MPKTQTFLRSDLVLRVEDEFFEIGGVNRVPHVLFVLGFSCFCESLKACNENVKGKEM